MKDKKFGSIVTIDARTGNEVQFLFCDTRNPSLITEAHDLSLEVRFLRHGDDMDIDGSYVELHEPLVNFGGILVGKTALDEGTIFLPWSHSTEDIEETRCNSPESALRLQSDNDFRTGMLLSEEKCVDWHSVDEVSLQDIARGEAGPLAHALESESGGPAPA